MTTDGFDDIKNSMTFLIKWIYAKSVVIGGWSDLKGMLDWLIFDVVAVVLCLPKHYK